MPRPRPLARVGLEAVGRSIDQSAAREPVNNAVRARRLLSLGSQRRGV